MVLAYIHIPSQRQYRDMSELQLDCLRHRVFHEVLEGGREFLPQCCSRRNTLLQNWASYSRRLQDSLFIEASIRQCVFLTSLTIQHHSDISTHFRKNKNRIHPLRVFQNKSLGSQVYATQVCLLGNVKLLTHVFSYGWAKDDKVRDVRVVSFYWLDLCLLSLFK